MAATALWQRAQEEWVSRVSHTLKEESPGSKTLQEDNITLEVRRMRTLFANWLKKQLAPKILQQALEDEVGHVLEPLVDDDAFVTAAFCWLKTRDPEVTLDDCS